jgi:hypothetical protein
MADALNNRGFDDLLRNIGPDATATFDNSASIPTEHASSEATNAATAVDGDDEDEELEEEDDDAAEEEEDDEDNEEDDVEDEAGV